MAEVTATHVRAVIDANPDIDLDFHIETGNDVGDWLKSKDTNNEITAGLLHKIKTYLAAHFYALRDPQYQSESNTGASATYQGQTGMGLDLTWWGQQAKAFDPTGILETLDSNEEKVAVGLFWLGKTEQERVDYYDRNLPTV